MKRKSFLICKKELRFFSERKSWTSSLALSGETLNEGRDYSTRLDLTEENSERVAEQIIEKINGDIAGEHKEMA